jgi:hypothetical protein
MGVLAYLFKFQPDQLMDFDEVDLAFWRQQADSITKSLNSGK